MKLYLTPRMALLFWLGMISGLPLALTAGTLTAWLTQSGVDIEAIGLFALVSMPYAYKFIWAPLMDGFKPPLLGRLLDKRRGWMLLWILCMAALCFAMSLFQPDQILLPIAILAVALAFASASFDINLDAYRIEMLPVDEQGAAAAVAVYGYRVGILISGGGALALASRLEWSGAYQIMALVLLTGCLPALLFPFVKGLRAEHAEENVATLSSRPADVKQWLNAYVVQPFKNFAEHPGWKLILLFIILFKIGDAFLGFMTNPFLLKAGYSNDQIAAIVKGAGFFATMFGSFFGGWLVTRLGMMRSLIIGGILQATANLPYAYLAMLNAPDLEALTVTIAIDNFCGGLATVAFVAYISSLCNLRFTATQYALLNSLAAFGRSFFTAGTGVMVSALGWPMFFITTALLGLPSLFVLWRLQKK